MKLYDAILLFDRLYLTSKSPAHRVWMMGRLGDVAGGKQRPNSLAAVVGDVDMALVTAEDLQLWANSLCDQSLIYADARSTRPARFGQLSPHTIDGYRRALVTFWRWACAYHERTGVGGDLTPLLQWPDPPRADEEPPKAASEVAVRKLLALPHLSVRDEAIIRFICATGARVSELVGLRRADLNLPQRFAYVRGKGRGGNGKIRAVVFDRPTATALKTLLSGKRRAVATEAVFLREDGGALSADGIRQMLRRRSAEAGLDEPMSPHRLRHFWAVQAVQADLQESHVQDQLGHSDMRTTRRYAKFMPHQRLKAYDEAFGDAVIPVRSKLQNRR